MNERAKRPTIRDVASAAGVSVATVNRVLGGSGTVSPGTLQRVQAAAATIGFYGFGAIQRRVAAARPKLKLGFLLLQPHRVYYREIASAMRAAAAAHPDCEVETRIEFLEDLSPQSVALRMLELGETCAAVAVVAAMHPLVIRAVETLQERQIPVFALISPLSAAGQVPYVGLDNWKVGRTAAWATEHFCRTPGKLGILVGNHRYQCQEQNESGFRSYFREHAPGFTLLEPLSTFEESSVAEEMTEKLLREHPDLAGLFVSGGGITGAMRAVRSMGHAGRLFGVGHQLMDVTRQGLLDGATSFIMSMPLSRFATETIAGMIRAARASTPGAAYNTVLPFEIYTRENI